ncbi:hypothetical protein [Robertkochia sediminum]|uniref:hypothetical protein n=1 Tax=Robertkochia sediminum TaxID=2785326 RepID=UPI001931453A|nr:hypothetical protein [Robertkochia sediminum]MBL7472195.1 hypothetical protein [Robertkochia sediminum]
MRVTIVTRVGMRVDGEMGKSGTGKWGSREQGNGEVGKWGSREMGKSGNGEVRIQKRLPFSRQPIAILNFVIKLNYRGRSRKTHLH